MNRGRPDTKQTASPVVIHRWNHCVEVSAGKMMIPFRWVAIRSAQAAGDE
jgi:hypothetical protein